MLIIVKIILLNVKFQVYSEPAQCIQKKCSNCSEQWAHAYLVSTCMLIEVYNKKVFNGYF